MIKIEETWVDIRKRPSNSLPFWGIESGEMGNEYPIPLLVIQIRVKSPPHF